MVQVRGPGEADVEPFCLLKGVIIDKTYPLAFNSFPLIEVKNQMRKVEIHTVH